MAKKNEIFRNKKYLKLGEVKIRDDLPEYLRKQRNDPFKMMMKKETQGIREYTIYNNLIISGVEYKERNSIDSKKQLRINNKNTRKPAQNFQPNNSRRGARNSR